MTTEKHKESRSTLYEERETYKPFILFEYDHEPGSYCLMLSDGDMVQHCHLFEARGYEGGGYSWEGVARQCAHTYAPEVEGRFDCDPEAGTFVAFGKDLDALQRLARSMFEIYHDEERLRTMIEEAQDGWIED